MPKRRRRYIGELHRRSRPSLWEANRVSTKGVGTHSTHSKKTRNCSGARCGRGVAGDNIVFLKPVPRNTRAPHAFHGELCWCCSKTHRRWRESKVKKITKHRWLSTCTFAQFEFTQETLKCLFLFTHKHTRDEDDGVSIANSFGAFSHSGWTWEERGGEMGRPRPRTGYNIIMLLTRVVVIHNCTGLGAALSLSRYISLSILL